MSRAIPFLRPWNISLAWCKSDEHFRCSKPPPASRRTSTRELDVQQLLGDVDQMQARIRRRLASDAPSLQRLTCSTSSFILTWALRATSAITTTPTTATECGAAHTRGIPISLAVLWMELAQGLGLHVRGVGFFRATSW